ncbi:MAG: DNA polymerase IV [Chloroflexi bacterium]|nr:DNA polymerase IV [Chloroflexota bacterium]MBP7045690.1 DNA polymerase IV [Chloroflexota bacterium]
MSIFGDTSTGCAWPQAVLHLDMDAFYVNVHILDHAEDAGVPLVIGGQPNARGVVASASYEARKLGIRSAMPTSTAVHLCPHLKIVPANWPRIRECSRQVMDILAEYGPVEQISVDEAYIDLADWADPLPLAEEMRTAVYAQTQLPASVGLATSKLVAKVASDHEKPAGCTIVLPGYEAEFLAPLGTRVIWGIGPRTAERLAALGIHTCGQLAAAETAVLRAQFGRQAEDLQRRALGQDERQVHAERGQPKSISQEWTFNQDVNDPARLQEQLRWQAASVSKSLKKRNLIAHTVRVKFRWADFTTFTRQRSIEIGVDGEEEIYRLARAIWQENWPPGRRMRLIGVGVSGLAEVTQRQLGFRFGDEI